MSIKLNYYFCVSLIIFSIFFNFILYDESWIFNMVENYSNYKSLITFHNEKIIWTYYLKLLSKIYFKIEYFNFFILLISLLIRVGELKCIFFIY